MKKVVLILLSVFALLMTSVVFAGESDVGKTLTFSGEGVMWDKPLYVISGADGEPYFNIDEMKASAEFMKCIDDGNYKGNLEITAKVGKFYPADGVYELEIDESATCKRL
jgi:hypothetical protein